MSKGWSKPDEDGISKRITDGEKEFLQVKNSVITEIIDELDEIIEKTEEGQYPTFIEKISSEEEFQKFVEMMAMNHFNALAEENKKIKDLKILLNMHMWNEWIKWSAIKYLRNENK